MFSVEKSHLNAEALVKMVGKVLSTIDGAMLPSCATEGEHQGGKATVNVALHMEVGQSIDMLEEGMYLAIFLKKTDDGLVATSECLVLFVATGVVRRTAVEDIATAIAALVGRYPLFIRK